MMQSDKTLSQKMKDVLGYFRDQGIGHIDSGLILGTGLGDISRVLTDRKELDIEACPHLSASTALAHNGTMCTGKIGKYSLLVFEGRRHIYEGCSMQDIVMPIYTLKALGASEVLMTNAAGGLNPEFAEGDLMIAEDYINFMGTGPLEGPNDDAVGGRFPDMIAPYDQDAERSFLALAREYSIRMHRGVFCGVRGPQLETRAEYRMLRNWGCDAVGMSTVPETIAAMHAGIRVSAIACITDLCFPEALHPVDIPKILAIAKTAGPKFQTLIKAYFEGKNNGTENL